MTSVRLILQMRIHNRLHLDDYFLIFSCVCITVGTALCYVYIGLLYWIQELDLNPTRSPYLLAEHVDFIADINLVERLVSVFTTLMFTAIFAVKLAYLAFFRRLVDRIRPLIIYWRVVTAITILSFPIGIILSFLACTETGPEVGKHITYVIHLIGLKLGPVKCAQPSVIHRGLRFAAVGTSLDIGTDVLLVGIPIRLLWLVNIKLRQKFIVGLFLCLNLLMVVVAAIRVSNLIFRGNLDLVWLFIWSLMEACVAVSMISLTVFRSAFVDSESSRARRRADKKPWYSSTIDAIKRNKAHRLSDEEGIQGQSEIRIPSATLTGMRSFIQKGHHNQTKNQTTNVSATLDRELDQWPLNRGCHE